LNRFRQWTIFLAEDNPDDIEITRRALTRSHLGCELIVARDGVEALTMLRDESLRLDFALLDINLPKLNGLQVLEQVRLDPRLKTLPIVVLSASDREEDVRRAYELGANSYIQKPVVFEKFVAVLEVLGQYWFEIARLPRSP